MAAPDFRASDICFMRLALREAWKGRGRTSPNPMVGAVIVAHGKVIARGYHAHAGGPHAEIVALSALSSFEQARGATLYVTLEPCSTYGRTPPCTEAILQAGIKRVVYGATDPNPLHQGRGKTILEQAGLLVTEGILAEKCTSLNHAWNYRMKTGMPWVIAKCGMSLDGRISSPHRRWITSETSRHHAMLFRRYVDAILVGGNTVRCDNPLLTIRRNPSLTNHLMIKKCEDYETTAPYRIVWTRRKEHLPQECHLLSDEHRHKTIVLENCSLRQGLQSLAKKGISSVLIEGGGITLGKAFEDHLVNEIRIYVAPLLLGGTGLALSSESLLPPSLKLKNVTYRQFPFTNEENQPSDLLLTALVVT